MPVRIGPKRPPRVFLREWREAKRLTQEQLAGRLDVSGVTVHRWETSQVFMNTNVLAAVAEALDIEFLDIFRPPERPSADALLADQSPEVHRQAMEIIKTIRKTGT
jgi:transcriptional regulator with XRE-family HTH domain